MISSAAWRSPPSWWTSTARSLPPRRLAAALKAADVEGKWAASAWGKKIARQQARKNLTDFDRYKVMVARVKRRSSRRPLPKLSVPYFWVMGCEKSHDALNVIGTT